MTLEAILAYLHILAILTMVVFLASEAALCRVQWLNAAVVERLAKIDAVYGIAAMLVLATGIARTWWGVKGTGWYWTNPLLHVKVTLFVVIGLLSIKPTITFIRWRKELRATGTLPDEAQIKATRKLVMIQAHFLPLIPLAAAFWPGALESDVNAAAQKRAICQACQRPASACICQWVRPVQNEVEVLILQHPLEVNHAKGTARLLHMSLPRSRLVTGEVFDESLFEGGRHVLLYPDTPQAGLPEIKSLSPEELADTNGLCLVVLDGTWRKSLKMLHLNPALQKMPRLSLADLPASNYRIRKARLPHQLSTLEATCAALAQLEGDAGKFEPLLDAFDGFVAEQIARDGRGLNSVGS